MLLAMTASVLMPFPTAPVLPVLPSVARARSGARWQENQGDGGLIYRRVQSVRESTERADRGYHDYQ